MTFNRRLLPLLLMLCVFASARAASTTSLQVELGWNGAYRFGRWAPIYITAADAKPRNVIVELYVPHDQIHAMNIRQALTIGPAPTTIMLLAPLGGGIEDMSVKIVDASSHRTLATWLAQDVMYGPSPSMQPISTAQLIGISGRDWPNPMLPGQLTIETCTARAIDPLRLPAAAIGYDSLNLLMLNQPDLSRLGNDQQQALVDWVRAGGRLICWMSEDAMPASSPLLDALPALVGDNISVDLSESAVKNAGLPPRFRNLKGRALTPTPDAQRVPLFNGGAAAYSRRVGFGSILLLPIDPSSFLFEDSANAHNFWRPLVAGAVQLEEPKKEDQANGNVYYNSWNEPTYQRRNNAITGVMDRIGDIPGAGQFGFWYIALAMGGLMLVVGPIDWIVLKRLGKQPWTWATTSGWIFLITLGAVYMGHVFKSGDLHYRTIRLIDQADGLIVASTDAIAIYSPRSTSYSVDADPESWCEPMTANAYWSRGGMKIDFDFHQDYRGTTPLPMRVNVWNVRFMLSQQMTSAPPVVDASLHLEHRDSKDFVVGTITNRGNVPLGRVAVECRAGYVVDVPSVIAAGATKNIDLPLSPGIGVFKYDELRQYTQGPAVNSWDFAIDRTLQLETMLKERGDIACVYATVQDPPAAAELLQAPTQQQHWRLIRAIVPLEKKD